MVGRRGKSLDPDRNERLRRIVDELVQNEFSGNVTHAAKAFGVSQPLVSEFLAGGRGAGPKLLEGIADHTGRSLDDLLGRTTHIEYDQGHDLSPVAIGRRADWQDARDECERKYGKRLAPYPGILDGKNGVAGLAGAGIYMLTADIIFDLAGVLMKIRDAADATAKPEAAPEPTKRKKK